MVIGLEKTIASFEVNEICNLNEQYKTEFDLLSYVSAVQMAAFSFLYNIGSSVHSITSQLSASGGLQLASNILMPKFLGSIIISLLLDYIYKRVKHRIVMFMHAEIYVCPLFPAMLFTLSNELLQLQLR